MKYTLDSGQLVAGLTQRHSFTIGTFTAISWSCDTYNWMYPYPYPYFSNNDKHKYLGVFFISRSGLFHLGVRWDGARVESVVLSELRILLEVWSRADVWLIYWGKGDVVDIVCSMSNHELDSNVLLNHHLHTTRTWEIKDIWPELILIKTWKKISNKCLQWRHSKLYINNIYRRVKVLLLQFHNLTYSGDK